MSPRLWVPGVPAPQGSKRYLGRSKAGKVRMMESSKRAAPWRADVRAKAEAIMDGLEPSPHAIVISARFIFTRPKDHYGTGRNAGVLKERAPRAPIVPPDLDKLERAVLDALTGIAYHDDKQVVAMNTAKEYGNVAGAEIRWDVIA